MSDHTQKRDNHTAGETPEFFTASDFHYEVGNCEEAAAIANRILSERGVRVYGGNTDAGPFWCEEPGRNAYVDTHQALLIGVTKIEADSWAKFAEDLLKEDFTRERLYKRAKELLNG